MRSTFGGLEIAKRSLFAQQTALQTTGHNIANANTQGYTRQVVNLTASRPMEAPGMMRSNSPGQMGTGVEFDQIRRIRESFLDKQFHDENKSLGNWTVRKDALEKLEAIFNEPSDTGIRQVVEQFWNAWQVVSKEPENTTARASLKETAIALTDSFNHTSNQLNSLKSDLSENIRVKATQVNSIIGQVASLNREIFRVEGLGNKANDLRDQRDLIVDELSGIINIKVTQEQEGYYNIAMGNVTLVDGVAVTAKFALQPDSEDLPIDEAFSTGNLSSGEMYGMIIARDQNLQQYMNQLDSMVRTLVEGEITVKLPKGTVLPAGTELNGVTVNTDEERILKEDTSITVKGVNGLHALGYSLGKPPESGIPFFSMKDGATEFSAGSIQVNAEIVGNTGKIASSARVLTNGNAIVRDANGHEVVVKGNNDIALAIATMRNERMDFDPSKSGGMMLTNGTFDEFYRAVVGQLGIAAQEANRQTTNQQALVDQVDGRRMSVSGVSLDEEMANLIMYQHAYNAAARAMTTYDEMLDKIINGMGTVGR